MTILDYVYMYIAVNDIQGNSKVFTTGQARVNPEDYVIKCVGGRQVLNARVAC